MKGDKVLVTGGAGLVGMNLTARLRTMGAKVTSTWHHKEPIVRYSDVDYIHTDLTDFKNCLCACDGKDYVIMAAAVITGAKGMSNTDNDLVTPNNLIQLHLLRVAYESR